MKPPENTEQNQMVCASETDAENKKKKRKKFSNFQSSFEFSTLWEYE